MLPQRADINVGDVYKLGERFVFVVTSDVAKVPILDRYNRVAVRNVATGRLSYVPWQRLMHSRDEQFTRLVAAAPDLLRAAKLVASFAMSWQPLTPGDIKELTNAIAKAEGRS